MSIDIFNHLSSLDQGSLANIVNDARAIELVSQIQKGRGAGVSRGEIIADAVGGARALIIDKSMRNKLFLSFSLAQEEIIKNGLGVNDIYNFRLTKERRQKLCEIFSIDDYEEEDLDTIDKEAVGAVPVKYGLFQHQSKALLEAIEYLNNDKPVMLHMPTGAGKTRTAMHLISRYLNKIQNGVVIWLVHGIELCVQASTEFKKAWIHLGERPIPIIEMWGGKVGCKYSEVERCFENSGRDINTNRFNKEIWPIDLNDAVVIASIDSINRLIDTWEPGERVQRTNAVRLIVFDEAHQAVAKTYKRAIELMGPKASLLGLSATPGRRHHGHDGGTDNDLVNLFGSNKVNLNFPGYKSPVEALIDQGYLAKLQKERLEVANNYLSKDEIQSIRRKLSDSLDIDEGFMRIVGMDGTRNLQIVNKTEQLTKEGHQRVILFAPSMESSNIIANVLRSLGVSAQSITNRTSPENRNRYLVEYLSDSEKPKVLCNYGVLTTGFDAPKTSAVLIARPTTSIVLLSQMAGRAIRGPKVGGNPIAKMVTVVDTAIPELVETINQFHAFDKSWGNNE